MSSPATDAQLQALADKLHDYPQSTLAEQGASPDMKRYLYAQEQLKGQGKARVRTWPNNKSGCPVLQEEVAKLKQQIPEKYLTKQPVLVGAGRKVDLV